MKNNGKTNYFSRVREGLGAQVGGTWVTKSCPRGVRTAKMTSKSAASGVRPSNVGPVRLDCLSELWIGLETVRDLSQIGVQSPCIRQDMIRSSNHTHTHIYIYIYIYIKASPLPLAPSD